MWFWLTLTDVLTGERIRAPYRTLLPCLRIVTNTQALGYRASIRRGPWDTHPLD